MSMTSLHRNGRVWLLLSMAVCAAIYWPGLHGGYLFDDFPNIVANPDINVGRHPGLSDWIHAVWSSHTNLKRPLAMVSFAINVYFTGLNPFPMKLVNLLIHLVNGWLLYRVLVELLAWDARLRGLQPDRNAMHRPAAIIVALWLLLPINVSSVLYVVQRMESLAQMFVLCGLWAYLHLRQPERNGDLKAFAVMMLMTAAGLLSKETAALLPLYALLVEFSLLNFRTDAGPSRRLQLAYTLLVIIPGLLAAFWIIRHDFNAAAYSTRDFTPVERLLSEARVVCHYVVWILLPSPTSLSFYHDQFAISHGLLEPPTTLTASLALASLLAGAIALRRRRPLLSLGILWFFAAHLLTATFIPLELIFEHRNYFASIGALLAAASVTLDLHRREPRAAIAIAVTTLFLYAFMTSMRARDWGDPLQFAYAEVDAHPESPRANYELGRMLVIASGYKPDSPFLPKAIRVLEHNASLPGSSILPLSALILVANRAHQPIDPSWWSQIIRHLSLHPPTIEDVTALQDLSQCQVDGGDCKQQVDEMVQALNAAMSHPGPSTILLMTYGDYVSDHLGDYETAIKAIRRAVAQAPGEIEIQLELIKVLMLGGHADQTAPIVEQLHHENVTPEQSDKLRRMLGLPRAVSSMPLT